MSPSIRYRAPARLSWASGRWKIHHCEVYVRRLGVTLDSLSRRLREASCRAKFPSTSSAGSGKQCLHLTNADSAAIASVRFCPARHQWPCVGQDKGAATRSTW